MNTSNPKVVTLRTVRATPRGQDGVLDLMRDEGIPLTVENYLDLAVIDGPIGPELVAALPRELEGERPEVTTDDEWGES